MQTKAGRNAPCPCGSGKKYKVCCLGRTPKSSDPSHLSPRFRFKPGSYGGSECFLPSLACMEQWRPDEWRHHFVLVKHETDCLTETEAVLEAEGDLKQAFAGAAPTFEHIAECLRNLGYVRVDDFKVIDEEGE